MLALEAVHPVGSELLPSKFAHMAAPQPPLDELELLELDELLEELDELLELEELELELELDELELDDEFRSWPPQAASAQDIRIRGINFCMVYSCLIIIIGFGV